MPRIRRLSMPVRSEGSWVGISQPLGSGDNLDLIERAVAIGLEEGYGMVRSSRRRTPSTLSLRYACDETEKPSPDYVSGGRFVSGA